MRYIVEEPFDNFEPWGGAQGTFLRLTFDELSIIENFLDEIPFLTETQVNDFLWFDVEIICDLIGVPEDDFVNRRPRITPHWWTNQGW